MSLAGQAHNRFIYSRRMRILASHLSDMLPHGATVLDVGCGDGMIASLIMKLRPDISIFGIDILVRDRTFIPVTAFDGRTIPYDTAGFDAVMFVDVLHHTEDPLPLLREAKRVSRGNIVLKDHTRKGLLAASTLRFMDWVGNAHHGVVLPYNYWTDLQWHEAFKCLGLTVQKWEPRIGLYPWPASFFFDRSLHFVALLTHE